MATKLKKRTRAEAKKLMWEYYRENKEILPNWIREHREEIILSLSRGVAPKVVFNLYSGNNKEDQAIQQSRLATQLQTLNRSSAALRASIC